MKRIVFLTILTISIISFSNPLSLIFKDAIVNFEEMKPGQHILSEDENILWVEGSESWSIKANKYNFSFNIIDLNQFTGEIKEIEDNIYEVIDSNKILFYNSNFGKWATTDRKNLAFITNSKYLTIDSKNNVLVATYKNASWNMVYELYPDGRFTKNVEILNANTLRNSKVYLINDYLQENIQNFSLMTRNIASESKSYDFQENIVQNIYTLDLGILDINSEKSVINIDSRKIILFEDYLEIPLSYSVQNTNPYVTRYIENTKENGLGIEIPKGKLWINEEFDDKIVPLNKLTIESHSIGESIILNMEKSWDFNYSNHIISDVKINDETRMIQRKIKLSNLSNNYKWVMISEKSANVQLDDYSVNDDYDTLINDSKKGEVNIKIKMNPNSNMSLDLIYKK
jgi:hypothetical protein